MWLMQNEHLVLRDPMIPRLTHICRNFKAINLYDDDAIQSQLLNLLTELDYFLSYLTITPLSFTKYSFSYPTGCVLLNPDLVRLIFSYSGHDNLSSLHLANMVSELIREVTACLSRCDDVGHNTPRYWFFSFLRFFPWEMRSYYPRGCFLGMWLRPVSRETQRVLSPLVDEYRAFPSYSFSLLLEDKTKLREAIRERELIKKYKKNQLMTPEQKAKSREKRRRETGESSKALTRLRWRQESHQCTTRTRPVSKRSDKSRSVGGRMTRCGGGR
jgi:hypothetical protein